MGRTNEELWHDYWQCQDIFLLTSVCEPPSDLRFSQWCCWRYNSSRILHCVIELSQVLLIQQNSVISHMTWISHPHQLWGPTLPPMQ